MKLKHIDENSSMHPDDIYRSVRDTLASMKANRKPGVLDPNANYPATGDAQSQETQRQNREYHADQSERERLRGHDRLEEMPITEDDIAAAKALGIRQSDIPMLHGLLSGKVKFLQLPQPVRNAIYKVINGLPYDQSQNITPELHQKLTDILSEDQLNELTNDLLRRYKTAAAADAGAAEKTAWDPESSHADSAKALGRSNKRFSGIVKATKKQFANDKKARETTEEGMMGGINRSAPATDVSYEKVLDKRGNVADNVYEQVMADYRQEIKKRNINEFSTDDQNDNENDPYNGWSKDGPHHYDDFIDFCSEFTPGHPNFPTSEYYSEDLKFYKGFIRRENGNGLFQTAEFIFDEPVGEGPGTGWMMIPPESTNFYNHLRNNTNENSADPSSPIGYIIIDPQDNNRVMGKYRPDGRSRANARRDKLDNAYGAYRYRVKPVYPGEEHLLKENKHRKRTAAAQQPGKQPNFTDILNKQHQDKTTTGPAKAVSIPFHGWEIKYKPNASGQVDWVVIRGDKIRQKGVAATDKEAVGAAEDWIRKGADEKKSFSKNATIDFNKQFVMTFAPDAQPFYATFTSQGGQPYIIISNEPHEGLSRSSIRAGTNFPSIHVTPTVANPSKLQPHGRYIIDVDKKEDVDDPGVAMYPLVFQGIIHDKSEREHMSGPGFTVAYSRGEMEEALDPWHGYTPDDKKANAQARAPSYAKHGSVDVPFSELVCDTIRTHGIRWAFQFYVVKHGLPPRMFKIFAKDALENRE